VGICAFKGKPEGNRVEIAYGVMEEYEGRGIATEACRLLVEIARRTYKGIEVIAQTLPDNSASARVLEKNDFKFVGRVNHPEDGEVLEWVFAGKSL
jgi:RimJ/RimL family protein N-acetyltransferase